jgi:hypothetical protein
MAFEIGIAFIVIISCSAAFIFDSPYRSPFSDFINFVFRIFLDKPIPILQVHLRTIGIPFTSICGLAASGYLAQKHNPWYLPSLYYALICVFALIPRGRESDMQPPRLFNLPLWISLSSVISFSIFVSSTYLIEDSKSKLWILPFVVGSILLCFQTTVAVKMSETRPNTVEAEAVSWFLKTSSNTDPAWFEKAAQIGRQSPFIRSLLVEKLLPLLSSLIVSPPEDTHGNAWQRYINTLANLMEFEPKERSFRRNEAAIERPTLPKDLIDILEELKRNGAMIQEPCVIDNVNRILQHHKPDKQEELEAEAEESV